IIVPAEVAVAAPKDMPKPTTEPTLVVGPEGVEPIAAEVVEGDWGVIRGQLVWGGDAIPTPAELNVDKDKDWCLGAGPLREQTVVVNPDTKGMKNVFVYLRKPSAIHPSYPQTAEDVNAAFKAAFKKESGLEFSADALQRAVADKSLAIEKLAVPAVNHSAPAPFIDQIRCLYMPFALVVREGQPLLVKNPEPIPHNVKVSSLGGKNDANPNMPPGTIQVFDWVAETQPMNVECSIHPWMKMTAMCFDHPYFAVTDADGKFELKYVPSGEVSLVARDPKYIDVTTGGKGKATGSIIAVEPGQTVDLGQIKVVMTPPGPGGATGKTGPSD
ncbi:MAG: carboxypeptidase regulatory-like domain-containing protein, partial [Planctomycetia bacterium]